ncbi:MAG: GvpL/GvpF family gas vesicle protein [bacterium]
MDGIYIYCLTKKGNSSKFKANGLDDRTVQSITCKEIMALVHPCEVDSFQVDDANKVIDWAMIHHKVVEDAWQFFGTLIPLRFGSIIRGEDEEDAGKKVKAWIHDIYDHIQERFEDLKDKAEYGIQIFWPTDGLMKRVARNNTQVRVMEKMIAGAGAEAACTFKDKQRSLLQRCIAKEIVQASRSLLDRVRPYLNDFQIEQITGGDADRRMLLNISCLLSDEQITEVKQALEEIQGEDGYIPQLSGPWPPYSFARLDDNLYPSKGRIFHVQPGGRVRCV